MPSLQSRIVPLDTTKYERMETPAPQAPPPDQLNNNLMPGLTTNLRCTMPPIYAATDNLRQFYLGGQTPQFRTFPLAPLTKS